MEETYQAYVNRVAQLTVPSHYQTQLQNIQRSPKYAEGKPTSFPGYTVVSTPRSEDKGNEKLYAALAETQQQLCAIFASNLLIPVPLESFHLTIADLIWDDSYKAALQDHQDYEQQLRTQVAQSFGNYVESAAGASGCQWQLLGITIRPRALEVCLVPTDEASYQKIAQLRRTIYQNRELIGLGVQQQYNFSAHMTLGYFGEIPPDLKRDRLLDELVTLNDRWLETEPLLLSVAQAELRKFDDMTHYYREADWPVVQL